MMRFASSVKLRAVAAGALLGRGGRRLSIGRRQHLRHPRGRISPGCDGVRGRRPGRAVAGRPDRRRREFGTSGGPALDERGRVAGVAFSSYAGEVLPRPIAPPATRRCLRAPPADNIGYLVPASVVEAFLREAELNERCPGLCALGISWQTAQNKALRRSLGLRRRRASSLRKPADQ